MTKKKILFVMESLRIGGAEKSLVTILSLLDYSKYDVSLILFRHDGEFKKQVPSAVKIVPEDTNYKIQSINFKNSWIRYLRRGDIKRAFYSFSWLLCCFFSKNILKKEYIGWKKLKKLFTPVSEKYDIAIGFLEKATTYYVSDLVKANKKIAFMHTDYDSIPHNERLDNKVYHNINKLVVVSEHTGDTMRRHFPFLDKKIVVIKNMVSPILIKRMAEETPSLSFARRSGATIIGTVCRLTPPKNIDGAIRICSTLIKQGFDIQWIVIGDGEERDNLTRLISEYDLENNFYLLGADSNPYPYIKLCDLYVQPSRWEGFGITVAEAKVLCKPIITSGIPEFREQLIDGVTGLIGDSDNGIALYIAKLITDISLRQTLVRNLIERPYSNTELIKVNSLLEE